MYNDRKEKGDCLRIGEQKGWEERITKGHKELFGIITCLISWSWWVSYMYTCVKTYQPVCFKHVQSIVDQVFTIACFLLFSLSWPNLTKASLFPTGLWALLVPTEKVEHPHLISFSWKSADHKEHYQTLHFPLLI